MMENMWCMIGQIRVKHIKKHEHLGIKKLQGNINAHRTDFFYHFNLYKFKPNSYPNM